MFARHGVLTGTEVGVVLTSFVHLLSCHCLDLTWLDKSRQLLLVKDSQVKTVAAEQVNHLLLTLVFCPKPGVMQTYCAGDTHRCQIAI